LLVNNNLETMECSTFSKNGASDYQAVQQSTQMNHYSGYNDQNLASLQEGYGLSNPPNEHIPAGPGRIRPNGLLARMALPCQSSSTWDYEECYSYYADGCYNTCQFVEMGDIEDFMNNEKRKEKSRDAARSRRSKETEVFTDLATVLPVPQEQVSQLDKASVMRLAIAYLRVRDMINLVPEPPEPDDHKILVDDSIFLKSLEGFLVVMSSEGDVVYMSENVSDYLGITQIDLMGQNIFEYSHPCDHEEIKEILSAKTREESETPKSFFIRLKCTLTSKGRSVNLKSATYKVIHCTGHIIETKDDTDEEGSKGGLRRCLVAVGQPIPHPSNIEAPLPRQTFLTKHSLDMKFTDADDKIMMDVLGYDSEDLVGKSVYEYHHAMDSDSICSAFKCLFSKGQCETNRYRFLAKTGGYVWVLTQATLINDSKTMKPQSVVCVNYVIR
jgi:hypoxia-inducible factor 1 alpha